MMPIKIFIKSHAIKRFISHEELLYFLLENGHYVIYFLFAMAPRKLISQLLSY